MGWRDLLLGAPADGQRHEISIGDEAAIRAAFAGWIGNSGTGLPSVSETDALSIPAYGRAEDIIADTIAGLPFRAYEKGTDGARAEVPSVLDHPAGPYAIDSFAWMNTIVRHLVRYREAYLDHVMSEGGVLLGLLPVHPLAVSKVKWSGTGKLFEFKDGANHTQKRTSETMTQILGPGTAYMIRGTPIWETYKAVFQIAIAANKAAGRVFTGALIAGLITPADDEEDIPDGEAELIKSSLDAKISGTNNAGQWAIVNRRLKFDPWSQTNKDAMYLETRTMQIEEMARATGMPPHLLAAIDKQTSWGTGIAEQNIGLSRYTLRPFTDRIESAVSPLLGAESIYAEFDYKGLLQGSPAEEIALILDQVAGGIMSKEEARALLNLTGPAPQAEPLPKPAIVPKEGAA